MKGVKNKVLIVVDVQNDFCPGGALAVPHGDEVVPVINRIVAAGFDYAIVTQDWHPQGHCSFIENGGSWPKHCVQNTWGAGLHKDLKLPRLNCVFIEKGNNPAKEAYSGFEGTPLEKVLKCLNVDKVYVCGLATDYCVKATATDAQKLGFKTYVVLDACRGVNKENSDKAVEEMREAGVKIITSKEV